MSKPDDLVPATEAYQIEHGHDETHTHLVVGFRTGAGIVFVRFTPTDARNFSAKLCVEAEKLDQVLRDSKLL